MKNGRCCGRFCGSLSGFFRLDLAADFIHVDRADLSDQLFQSIGRQGTGLLEQHDLFAEHHQGRNGADAEGRGQGLFFFGVDLGEQDVRMLVGSSLKNRGEHAARSTPRRPEVDDDRLVGLDGFVEAGLSQNLYGHDGLLCIRRNNGLLTAGGK